MQLLRLIFILFFGFFFLRFNDVFSSEKEDNTVFPIGKLPNSVKFQLTRYLDTEQLHNYFLIGKGTSRIKNQFYFKNDMKVEIKKENENQWSVLSYKSPHTIGYPVDVREINLPLHDTTNLYIIISNPCDDSFPYKWLQQTIKQKPQSCKFIFNLQTPQNIHSLFKYSIDISNCHISKRHIKADTKARQIFKEKCSFP